MKINYPTTARPERVRTQELDQARGAGLEMEGALGPQLHNVRTPGGREGSAQGYFCLEPGLGLHIRKAPPVPRAGAPAGGLADAEASKATDGPVAGRGREGPGQQGEHGQRERPPRGGVLGSRQPQGQPRGWGPRPQPWRRGRQKGKQLAEAP